MQPQQPGNQAPQNNYDFIMSAGQAPRKAPIGGNSMATRILVVVGVLFLLAIIAAVAINFLGSAGKAFDEKAMLGIVQDQTEILRLSTEGTQDSVSQRTKNFSVTTKLSMATEQQKLQEYLGSKGYTPDEKLIAGKTDSEATSQLADAKSSSTYDNAYTSIMRTKLQTYMNDLKAAYEKSTDETKQQLSERYDNANLLLTQLGSN